MPQDGFLSKNFVRVVVSEVMFVNHINWACLIAEKWKKSLITNIISYYEG